jgi:hypothetical protein
METDAPPMTLAEVFVQEVEEIRENRRAFIVLGPEGSGTYMLANAIEAADPEAFVLRRSYPHAGEWPRIEKLIQECRFRSYHDITIIFILRDFYATAQSVLRRDPNREIEKIYITIRLLRFLR